MHGAYLMKRLEGFIFVAALLSSHNLLAEQADENFKRPLPKDSIECEKFSPDIKTEKVGSVLRVSMTNRHKDLLLLTNQWDKSRIFLNIDVGINYRLPVIEDPRSSQAILAQETSASEHIPVKDGLMPSKPTWDIYKGNWSRWEKGQIIYKEIDIAEAMKNSKRWNPSIFWSWPERDFGWTKPIEKSDKKPVAGRPWLVSVNAYVVAKECSSLIFSIGDHSIMFPDLIER